MSKKRLYSVTLERTSTVVEYADVAIVASSAFQARLRVMDDLNPDDHVWHLQKPEPGRILAVGAVVIPDDEETA